MHTKQSIAEQLRVLGVPQDRPVIVHSALRAVGALEGRGEALLDALYTHVTAKGGLLCVPTHTWHLMWNTDRPTLDFCLAETCVGTLSRLAILDGRGVRTDNPTHSMVVFGERARVADFVSGEREQETHTSPRGCYGKLYDMDGAVLLIGVGLESNTYLHCVEEMLCVPNRLTAETIPVSVRYPDGRVEHRRIYTFEESRLGDVSRRFPKFEDAFRAHGCIADGKIGDAHAMLCSARGMYRTMALLRERSGGAELLGDDEPIARKFY